MKFRVLVQLTGILLSVSSEIFAQGFVENALLFSRTRPGGSARIQAMGGAQIALGGDFSSALSNPAGLGMYNRSEVTFSPAYSAAKTDSEHFGTTETDSKNFLNIPGLSYVHHFPNKKGGFFGGSLGVSMTRTNNFNSNISYSGQDNSSSIIDYFIQDANEQFYAFTDLAFENYLLEDSSFFGGPSNYYFSVMGLYDDPDDIRRLSRNEVISVKGAQYQWSIAYGGNFNDRLFFGANIGVTSIRYSYTSVYRESNFSFDLDPDFNPLNNMQLEETIDVEGSGINLTLGVIYRPIDNLQLGASLVTPTYYQITDSYRAKLSTQWNNYNYLGTGQFLNALSDETGQIISEYTLTTPLKFSVGGAFFISDYGFITGDLELVNYKRAKYSSDIGGIDFNNENSIIKSNYKTTLNYRVGGEFRYEAFRFRAGYNVQSNPYKNNTDVDNTIRTFSLGVGFRVKKFFTDFAWLNSNNDSAYSPYSLADKENPRVNLKNQINTVMATFGLNF